VLAWGFQSEDYLQSRGYHVEQFRFMPPGQDKEPIVLYFLVADVYFKKMVEEFKLMWMNKVDMRPLSSMAFEFIPELGAARQNIYL